MNKDVQLFEYTKSQSENLSKYKHHMTFAKQKLEFCRWWLGDSVTKTPGRCRLHRFYDRTLTSPMEGRPPKVPWHWRKLCFVQEKRSVEDIRIQTLEAMEINIE